MESLPFGGDGDGACRSVVAGLRRRCWASSSESVRGTITVGENQKGWRLRMKRIPSVAGIVLFHRRNHPSSSMVLRRRWRALAFCGVLRL
ncbi:hypothetical protein Dimus_022014, partial [Dionaea muscipula]